MNRYSVPHAILAVLIAASIAGCAKETPDELLASAKEYLARNDNSAAVIQLRNALQKDAELAEARFLLGKALLATGDPQSAEKELREAAALQYPQEEVAPLWARSLVLIGQHRRVVDELAKAEVSNPQGKAELMTAVGEAHLALRDQNAARAAFSQALSANPKHAPALRGQARLAAATGDLNQAAARIDEALAIAPLDPDSLELKAGILMARKQPEQALEVYRKAVEAKPDMLRAHAAIISILMERKELEQAAKQVAAMKQIAPANPQTLYLQAWVAFRQKDLPAARNAIQQHLRVAPDNPRGLLLAGSIEYELQAYGQAETYLSQVLQHAPRQPLAWRLLIGSYLRSGQASRALERLQPILEQTNNDPALLALAGEVFMANGDAKQAADYFTKAAALDPKNSRSRTGLALSHLAQGETETAFRELEEAASTGTDLRADFALIAAHVRQREYDKALAAVNRLEKKQPNSPLPHNVRGGVLLAKGDQAAARRHFERALEIDPAYFPAAAQLARIDFANNKPDAARQRLEGVLAKAPNNLPALLALAELRARTGGSPQDVVALIQKAIAAHPADPAPRLALIQYHLGRRDFESAMLAAQGAMAAIPNRPEILQAAGVAHQAAGEKNQAMSIYRQLAALDPKSPVPLLRMADVQFAANNKDDAIESLKKALDVSPRSIEAQQALIRVYVDTGRTKEAIALAREVQKQRPKEGAGYGLEGDVYLTQKNWTEAANAYRTGLKHAESTDLAVKLYAALGAGPGGQAAASEFAASWLKSHPKDHGFRLRLAESALALKQYAAAAEQYRKVLESSPRNAIALNNLAWAESQLKDPRAIEHAEEANRIAPNQPAIMDTLGTLLVEKGDTARGLDLLRKASAQAPQAHGIRLNLAKAFLKAGQKDAARKELDELAKLGEQFPAHAEVTELKRGL